MTPADRRILDAFPPPPGETWALLLARAARFGHGTIAQCLFRLREAGLVADRWEDEEQARADGRPPRRLWRLTPDGQRRRFEERGTGQVGRPAMEGS